MTNFDSLIVNVWSSRIYIYKFYLIFKDECSKAHRWALNGCGLSIYFAYSFWFVNWMLDVPEIHFFLLDMIQGWMYSAALALYGCFVICTLRFVHFELLRASLLMTRVMSIGGWGVLPLHFFGPKLTWNFETIMSLDEWADVGWWCQFVCCILGCPIVHFVCCCGAGF